MATILSLFPARVKFTNDDGTLTPEAYRALQILFTRVGGTLGDNGTDVFANSMVLAQPNAEASNTDTIIQDPSPAGLLADVVQQPVSADFVPYDLMQPGSVMRPIPSGGAAPAGGVGVAAGGWSNAADRDTSINLLNNIRTCLILNGLMT